MRRYLAAAMVWTVLASGFLPSLQAHAEYVRGQSIAITKPNQNSAGVEVKIAVVTSVSAQSVGVTIFGLPYKVDISAAGANVSALTIGSTINISGTLDPADTTLIHALKIQEAGIVPGGGGGNGGGGSTAGLCATGSEDSDQGGIVEIFGEPVAALVRQALGCSSSWTLKPPPAEWRYNGTANYKILWRTWYYGWAMRAGTEAQKTDARDFLAEWFDRQLTEGHGFGEALTTSHYQIWLHGVTAARLLAVKYRDQKLLNSSGKWFRQEFGLYDLLVRDGTIYSPGYRMDGTGATSQLRGVAYALVKGQPLSGNAANPDSNFWKDYYNVGAWTLKNLLQLGDDLGGAAKATKASDLPVLNDQLCVYTKGNDFVFLFPKMTGLDVLFWVARVNGTVTRSPYTSTANFSGDNPFPAPELAGATLTAVHGVQSSSCPAVSGNGPAPSSTPVTAGGGGGGGGAGGPRSD